MGFRTGAYARVWEVEPKGDTVTVVRLSTRHKDKNTGNYVQDFSGFVSFCGTSNAAKAQKLKEKDEIKIGDCDVTYRYDKEKGRGYTNFKVFSFEMVERQEKKSSYDDPEPDIQDGLDEKPDSRLPF